ncbi:MFS transporter [Nanoarchaeota archaeon]
MVGKKGTIFAWAVYDLANTAFSALYITFFFPLLIKVYLGGNEFQLGLVIGISMLLAGIVVPIIGAISDAHGRKMPFVIFFTVSCVIFTTLTGYVGLYAALIFGLIANLTYHAAIDVYDAVLVDISNKKNIGAISGYGTALGYVGTILSLIMAYFLLNRYGWDTKLGTQAMFPATAAFFLLFSLVTFIMLKDKKKSKIKLGQATRKAFSEVKSTFTQIRKYKGLLTFLIASFIYNDGMNTAILFLYLYGREQVGLSMMHFFYVYSIMAVAAVFGSLIFGKLNDRIGPKKSLTLALVIWISVVMFLMNVSNVVSFLIAGSLGGAVLGAVWTVNRPMLVKLSPRHKIAEMFGFEGMTQKFSGVIGPILFGFLVVRFGYQSALISLLFFFSVGLLVLQKVPDV